MRAHIFLKTVALSFILLAAGCATFDESPRRAASEREDMLRLEEKINRMNGRIEAVELERQQLQMQVDQLKRSTASSDPNAAVKTRLDELDRKIQTLDAARESDKREIADAITKKLLPYLSQSGAASGGKSNGRPSVASGSEHEVQSGENLSKIAATYGVKVSELMAANGIDNPNMVRQGQKLIIPKP